MAERVYTKADVMNRRRERLATALAVLSVMLATVAAAGGFILARSSSADLVDEVTVSMRNARDIASDKVATKAELLALARQVSALQQSQSHEATPTSAELRRLDATLAELGQRQTHIEDAISRDPAHALEVPLLRKDLDNMKESQAQAIESINQRVNQVFDLNKWLLGAGALSLLAIALSTLLSHWKARRME